jgi:DNA-directed RNA polymerase subunit M/transcription elongation factor TFIIS
MKDRESADRNKRHVKKGGIAKDVTAKAATAKAAQKAVSNLGATVPQDTVLRYSTLPNELLERFTEDQFDVVITTLQTMFGLKLEKEGLVLLNIKLKTKEALVKTEGDLRCIRPELMSYAERTMEDPLATHFHQARFNELMIQRAKDLSEHANSMTEFIYASEQLTQPVAAISMNMAQTMWPPERAIVSSARCSVCGGPMVMVQKQIRSLDEPMTQSFVCTVCGTTG